MKETTKKIFDEMKELEERIYILEQNKWFENNSFENKSVEQNIEKKPNELCKHLYKIFLISSNIYLFYKIILYVNPNKIEY